MNDDQLQRYIEEVSLKYFNRPFLHRACFNSRLRSTGGRYMLRTGEIQISSKHYGVFGEKELLGIVKHELCHYHLHQQKKGYRHRDKEFKELLVKVGAPRHCSTLPKVSTKIYEYECKQCGIRFVRMRRFNVKRYCCGSCRGTLQPVMSE